MNDDVFCGMALSLATAGAVSLLSEQGHRLTVQLLLQIGRTRRLWTRRLCEAGGPAFDIGMMVALAVVGWHLQAKPVQSWWQSWLAVSALCVMGYNLVSLWNSGAKPIFAHWRGRANGSRR